MVEEEIKDMRVYDIISGLTCMLTNNQHDCSKCQKCGKNEIDAKLNLANGAIEIYELLGTLQNLFIPENQYQATYYKLDQKICVDSIVSAEKSEIQRVKNWIEHVDLEKNLYNEELEDDVEAGAE